ncbi:MAG: hypothetical protein Q7K43_02035, partial [Candidatus Woesearchaeota archaeon]|nr:hypothetical protein [Candidatus Woesearchaeota archaeon]
MERKLISISALLFFLFLGLFLINEFGEKKEAQTNSSTEISVPAIVSIKDLPKENISNSSNNESTKTSFLLESNASRVTKINESFEPKNATVPKKEEK